MNIKLKISDTGDHPAIYKNKIAWKKDGELFLSILPEFYVDTTPPVGTPAVIDDGAYTTSASELTASWTQPCADSESGIIEYQFAIGTAQGGTDVVSWTPNGMTASVTKTGLNLIDGTVYYFTVRAENGVGLYSAVGSSDGIKVDATPPVIAITSPLDGGIYTANVAIEGTAADGISQITSAVLTIDGGSGVNMTVQDGKFSRRLTGLSGGRHAITVSAKDTAGNIGSRTVTVTADTAPPVITITSPTDGSMCSANVTVEGAVTDDRSNISSVNLSVDNADSLSVEVIKGKFSRNLTGLAGGSHTITVTAKDAAGNIGSKTVTITVDATPPVVPVVTDDGDYTSSITQLHASWSSSDPESGIAKYHYDIGTSMFPVGDGIWTKTSDVSGTKTGLSLKHGKTYYFIVYAQNSVGPLGGPGYSDGITVDTTAPITPTVTDDGDYTTSATQLHASWNSSDPESGIVKYEYKITVDSKDGAVIQDWTDAGTAASVTKADLSLQPGKMYYFSIKAMNGAETWSDVGYSDGIKVVSGYSFSIPDGWSYLSLPIEPIDPKIESILAPIAGKYSKVTSRIAGTGPGTGAVVYDPSLPPFINTLKKLYAGQGFAILMKEAATLAVTGDSVASEFPILQEGWNFVGLTTAAPKTVTGILGTSGFAQIHTLKPGSPGVTDANKLYYPANFTAFEPGKGYWINKDSTPPATPVVTDDGDYTCNGNQLHATWSSTDSESGISEYQVAIGTTQGGIDIDNWFSVGTATQTTYVT